MTTEEMHEYLNGEPTIKGIVKEMKTWWSNEGSDKEIQICFDKILELAERKENGDKLLCSKEQTDNR